MSGHTYPAKVRRIVGVALFVTALLWLHPPVARVQRIFATPSIVLPLPSPHLEFRSESGWIWHLHPEDKIAFGILLARNFAVWTVAVTALHCLRRPAPLPSRGPVSAR